MIVIAFLLFLILVFCLFGLECNLLMNLFFGKSPTFVINQLNNVLKNIFFINIENAFTLIVQVFVAAGIVCFILLIITRKISGGLKWSGSAFICSGIVMILLSVLIANLVNIKEIGEGLIYAAAQGGIKVTGNEENNAIRLFVTAGITGAVSFFAGIVLIISGNIAKKIREKRRAEKKAKKPVPSGEETVKIVNKAPQEPVPPVSKEIMDTKIEEETGIQAEPQGKERKGFLKMKIPASSKKIVIFSSAGIALIFIIVFISLLVNRDTSIKTVIQTFTINASANESVSLKADNNLSVELPFGTCKEDDELVVSSVKNIPEPEGIKLPYIYDVSMKKRNRFDNLITISLPLETTSRPSLANNYSMPIAIWFDTGSKEWKPDSYELDFQSRRILIYTDHLTSHSVVSADSTETTGPVKKVPFPKYPCVPLFPGSELEDIGRILRTKGPNTREAILEGWTIGLTWFGFAGNAGTLAQEVLEIEQLDSLNTYAGNLGLGFALIQYSIDITSGNKDAVQVAYINLTKNLKDFAVGVWGTRYLKIANVAGFVIDYSLNQFYNVAIQSRDRRWEAGYREYYKDVNEKIYTKKWWYDNILNIISNVKNPDNFAATLDSFVYKYLCKFWELPYNEQFLYCEEAPQSLLPVKGDCPKDVQDKISSNYKKDLKGIIDEVSEQVERKIKVEQMDEVYDHLKKIQQKLNQVYSIKVILSGKKEQVANVPVALSAGPGWSGTTNGNGEWKLDFTLFGYLEAGAPGTATVTYKTKDNKTQVLKESFAFKNRNTTVTLTIPGEKIPEVIAQATTPPETKEKQTQTDTGNEAYQPNTTRYSSMTPDALMYLLEANVHYIANEVYKEKRYPDPKAVIEAEAIIDYIKGDSDEIGLLAIDVDVDKYMQLIDALMQAEGMFHQTGLKNPERFEELKRLSPDW